MPNEIDMLDDLEFENQINAMGDDQPALIKFVAWQQYRASKVTASHGKRIKHLEDRNKKVLASTAGLGTIIGGIIITLYNYFAGR